MDIDFIERLERKLSEELPGEVAQQKMMPSGRSYVMPEDGYKVACVMILLFLKNKEWNIAFIQRTQTHISDPHSGQIGLPGGGMEDEDQTYIDCALRETQEEIGVNAEDIGIVGELSPLYVSVSNYMVYPFVGFTNQEPVFEPQPSEVVDVIEVELSHLMDKRRRKVKDIEVRGQLLEGVPYFDIEGRVLWGATAMIISELIDLLDEVV